MLNLEKADSTSNVLGASLVIPKTILLGPPGAQNEVLGALQGPQNKTNRLCEVLDASWCELRPPQSMFRKLVVDVRCLIGPCRHQPNQVLKKASQKFQRHPILPEQAEATAADSVHSLADVGMVWGRHWAWFEERFGTDQC